MPKGKAAPPFVYDPLNLNDHVWLYSSRSNKSVEFYVRGESQVGVVTTLKFKVTAKRLRQILKTLDSRRGNHD